ncbi:hypothetical protein L7F22_063675 [Adiantum nelumboides]|nr:hypothetical protein [Adiantum nelumboides]MCO5609449.1 hypothetical protein [Adiantum nelumboides]
MTPVPMMVDMLHVSSAQIVSSGDTVMAVALDRSTSRMHLYRVVEEQLVLEESSGPELAQFVEDCALHYWYMTVCGSSPCIYIGMSVNEALVHNVQQALVEYDGRSRSWRHVALPKFPSEVEQEISQSLSTSVIAGVAYHELGLATDLGCPGDFGTTEG